MEFKYLKRLLIGSVLSLSCLVNSTYAGLITIGALTSNDDGSTTVIADSLNNLEWLRWDQYADLTYAQTLLQSAALGWSIAGVNDANLFINALFNRKNHVCADNNAAFLYCGDSGIFSSAQYTALLGDSSARGASSTDAAWFYSAETGNAGVLNLASGTSNEKFNSFGTIALTDTYASTNDESIGWLMYRAVSVAEPATMVMFIVGILGLATRRFKR